MADAFPLQKRRGMRPLFSAPWRLLVVTMLVGGMLLNTVSGNEMPRYRVTAWEDKETDFTALHTYAWTGGWPGIDPEIDQRAVAAIERELAARGYQKVDAMPCDVLVAYSSLLRIDVDLESFESSKSLERGLPREYPVGTLMVHLLEPQSRQAVFQVRADAPLADPATGTGQIDRIVAKMFKKYPAGKHTGG